MRYFEKVKSMRKKNACEARDFLGGFRCFARGNTKKMIEKWSKQLTPGISLTEKNDGFQP